MPPPDPLTLSGPPPAGAPLASVRRHERGDGDSSWPPGRPGRWLTVAMVSVATVGGAGSGLASLVSAARGDQQREMIARMEALAGRLESVEGAQAKTAERLIQLQATVEAREQARREEREHVSSFLRQRPPDPKGALEVLEE